MKIISSFGDLLKLLFKGDIARFVRRIFLLLPDMFSFNRYFYMEKERFDFSKPLIKNIEVLVANKAHIEDIVRISERNEEKIEYLLDNNVMVLISRAENEPFAGTMWSMQGHCYVVGAGWDHYFGDKTAYLFWSFIMPEARGKGLYMNMLKSVSDYYINKGVENFCCLVEFDNENSLNLHYKLGYETIKTITSIRIFSLKLTRVTDHVLKKSQFKMFIKEPKGMVRI